MNLAANNQNGQKLVYNYINHINQWQYTLSHNIHIQLDNKTKTTFTTEVLGTSTQTVYHGIPLVPPCHCYPSINCNIENNRVL